MAVRVDEAGHEPDVVRKEGRAGGFRQGHAAAHNADGDNDLVGEKYSAEMKRRVAHRAKVIRRRGRR
jgi:hypothetical protein